MVHYQYINLYYQFTIDIVNLNESKYTLYRQYQYLYMDPIA